MGSVVVVVVEWWGVRQRFKTCVPQVKINDFEKISTKLGISKTVFQMIKQSMLKLGLHEQLQKFKLANHYKAEAVEMTFVTSSALVKYLTVAKVK